MARRALETGQYLPSRPEPAVALLWSHCKPTIIRLFSQKKEAGRFRTRPDPESTISQKNQSSLSCTFCDAAFTNAAGHWMRASPG
jgi:hypothetical protein